MNIIILTPSVKKIGGVERFSSYLEQGLKKSGYTVSVLGIESLSRTVSFFVRYARYVGLEQPALGYLLGRCVRRCAGDVVITNGMLGWNIKNRVIINIQHGTFARSAVRIDRNRHILKYFFKRYVWGFFEGVAARRATRCVAVSEEVKESVARYYGVHDALVIHNGVDTDLFYPHDKMQSRNAFGLPPHVFVGIFVGRFEYAKGKDILEGIRQFIEERGGIFIIAENYSQSELVTLYSAADIFFLPSLHEGCSYALLEAMSCGLPFLVSPVGLVCEYVTKGVFSHCIVDEQTIAAYCTKLDYFMKDDPAELTTLSKDIRQYILQDYTLAHCNNAYIALIQTLV